MNRRAHFDIVRASVTLSSGRVGAPSGGRRARRGLSRRCSSTRGAASRATCMGTNGNLSDSAHPRSLPVNAMRMHRATCKSTSHSVYVANPTNFVSVAASVLPHYGTVVYHEKIAAGRELVRRRVISQRFRSTFGPRREALVWCATG